MADQIINTIKPILLEELTRRIKENEKQFDVVEAGIDDIIKKVKDTVKPISSPIVAGIKLIPFGNPSEKLQELANELKHKMDDIDLSALEKIPDLAPEITTRVKALPQKVKDKLKTLVDELILGTETTDVPPVAPPVAVTTPTETSVKDNLQSMSDDDKQKTIDNIMKMLEDTGILDEIKKRICHTPAVATTNAPILPNEAEKAEAEKAATTDAATTDAAPAPQKGGSRRKTKKNIRRHKRSYTKFGREF